jgi:hypothetical protein
MDKARMVNSLDNELNKQLRSKQFKKQNLFFPLKNY